VPRGRFDKKLDTRDYFRIDVVPSETGNGIWLRGADREDDGDHLDFYDLEGRQTIGVSGAQPPLRASSRRP
jgi:hypothetical protein